MKPLLFFFIILSFVFFSCKDQLMDTVTNEQQQPSCYKDVKQFIPDYSLNRYESVVTGLEKYDTTLYKFQFLKDPIIFYGSSSFAYWNPSIPQDFPTLPTIGHGFGGSTFPELIQYKERLVTKFKPKTILIYCENDLAGVAPKTVEQTLADFCALVTDLHAALPKTKIFVLSLKYSPSRRFLLNQYIKLNKLLSDYSSSKPYLSFIDINPAMVVDGKYATDGSIFQSDSLHMNRKGYERWISIIKPILEADYKSR